MTPPLDGVTVADFTTAHQGPWATQKLGDLGASVLKIERYEGEWSRELTVGGDRYVDGASPFWLAANRNKRSINLDLKADGGHRVALDIVSEADVLVENFRPGVMDRLGLGYEEVAERNPELVYVSASGFGSDGPYADRPGQDLLMQAISGIASATGYRDQPPTPVPFPVIDGHSAMQIVFYTMVALFDRERTGTGQRVDVNLLDSAIDSQCQAFTAELNMDAEFERSDEGIGQKYLPAPYGIYETRDGHVAIAMTPMDRLADALDLPELVEHDPYEERDELKRLLESHAQTRSSGELLNTLLDADVWAAEVNDYREAARDPQVEHNDIIVSVDHPEPGADPFETTGVPASFSDATTGVQRRPPRVGEHAREVLRELDYDEDLIDDLVAAEVTGRPE